MPNPELDATRKILHSMFRAELEKGGYSERSPRLEIVNLLTAEGPDLATFAGEIQKHGGKVPVMVHPYYQREAWFGLNPPFKPSSEFCAQSDRFIKTCIEHSVPLIIFEEGSAVHELPARLGNLSGRVYVIETGLRTPDPLCSGTGKEGWEDVGRILHRAGVSHVVVGGLLLELYKASEGPRWGLVQFPSNRSLPIGEAMQEIKSSIENIASQRGYNPEVLKSSGWLRKEIIPAGCVGVAAIGFLKQGFSTTLSAISASSSHLP